MSNWEENWIGPILGITVIVILSTSIWVIISALEAQAYNDVTGKNVSTWNAMFLDLRVQAEPKE